MGLRVEWFGEWRDSPCAEEGWALLGDLREPRLVARSRTTRTDAGLLDLPSGPVQVHRKVYSYRGFAAPLAGAFRTTFAAPSRARREVEALVRLAAFDFAPPPVGIAERRAAGFLLEARLAVRTVPGGAPLDEVPPDADLARALGRAVGAIHRSGAGDLSLSPRNVLASRGSGGAWTLAKVDSGRLASTAAPSIRARDLADLLAGLEGRWSREHVDAFRGEYEGAAGAWPEGMAAAMKEASGRRRRRERRV